MSTTVSGQVTYLLDRVRDVGGLTLSPAPYSSASPPSLASGEAWATTILSNAQRLINTLEENITQFVTWTPTAGQVLYRIDSDPILGTGGTSPIIKILYVHADATEQGEDIVECPFRQLTQSDWHWYERTGNQYQAWCRVGHDLFALYPAMTGNVQPIGIIAAPYLADLSQTGTFAVSDDIIPMVMALAEAIALFQCGQFQLAAIPLKRLQEEYKQELNDPWRNQLSLRT